MIDQMIGRKLEDKIEHDRANNRVWYHSMYWSTIQYMTKNDIAYDGAWYNIQ